MAAPSSLCRTARVWVPILATSALGAIACSVDDRVLSTAKYGSHFNDMPGDGSIAADSELVDAHLGKGSSLDSGLSATDASHAAVTDATPPELDGPCQHVDQHGVPDCGKTLASNADFDRNVTSWIPDASSVVKWDSKDSENESASGSLSITNPDVQNLDGWSSAGASQCLPVTAGATYAFQAQTFIPSGQSPGFAQIAVWFYQAPDCGGFVDTAYAVATSDATNAWTTAKGSLIAPATDASMEVRLVSQKAFRSNAFQVKFDAIRVEPQ